MSGLLVFRLLRQGLQRHADGGVEFAEHLVRMKLVLGFREGLWQHPRNLLELADAQFPAFLHLSTGAMGSVIGHSAEAAALSTLVWYVLLAASVGLLVGAVTGRRSGSAAACACLLLPPLHASVLRYYYDLPMTALLWLGVAVVVAVGPRRPLVGGLVGGLLLAAGTTTKWTALPFGASLVAAGAIPLLALGWRHGRARGVARAAGSGLVAVAVAGGLIWGYLQVAPHSLGWMMGTFHIDDVSSAKPLSSVFDKTTELVAKVGERQVKIGLQWYRDHVIASVLSRAVAYACVPLAVVWLLRSGRLVLFVVIAVGGQLFFLVTLVPVQDERFLLTALPCVALVAGLGWGKLPGLLRAPAAAALLVVGLGVAVDFHVPGAAEGRVDSDEWGLHSAVWQYGWARADEQPRNPNEGRRVILLAVRECPVEAFFRHPWGVPEDMPTEQEALAARDCVTGVLEREASTAVDLGAQALQACEEGYWMSYRQVLSKLRHDPDKERWSILEQQPPVFAECDPDCPGGRPAAAALCDTIETWAEGL